MIKKKLEIIKSAMTTIFGDTVELLPSVKERFEIEMAYLEYNILPKNKLLDRSAFLKSVDGIQTKHYQFCSAETYTKDKERSRLTNDYFEEGQFSTGYATHGLFPYRGKFHPQLIKGLLNILEVNIGDIVLDPMAGSGTANIECSLMGIDSYAIEISPFSRFMIRAKYDALSIENEILDIIPKKIDELFKFFSKGNALNRIESIKSDEAKKVYRLAFLAFLDAMGYSMRVKKSNHSELFARVLVRYYQTVKRLLRNRYFDRSKLGKVEVLNGVDAKETGLKNCSIDCVITSPPYSFAIDYVKNDKAQLEFLGYDPTELKQKMVGLRGYKMEERLRNYFSDMEVICSEVSRVLKKSKFFSMIIGSNTNQTGGIRLEKKIIEVSEKNGLNLIKVIKKPIKGMRNTMKDEYILIFQKGEN